MSALNRISDIQKEFYEAILQAYKEGLEGKKSDYSEIAQELISEYLTASEKVKDIINMVSEFCNETNQQGLVKYNAMR